MRIKDFINIDLLDERWTSIRIYVDATLALSINLLERDFDYSDLENFLNIFGEKEIEKYSICGNYDGQGVIFFSTKKGLTVK
jgi:hypothetical protein